MIQRYLLGACFCTSLVLGGEQPAIVKSVAVQGTSLRVNLATQVGAPFDARSIRKDVHTLWSSGRFQDVRVVASPDETEVVFHAVEARERPLHALRIEPTSYHLQLTIPEGTPLNPARAHQVALEAQKQLVAEGYADARVDYELEPAAGNKVDLRLKIKASDPVRVKEIEFAGNPQLNPKELRGALRALRIRRLLLGWRLYPSYSREAVDSDAARLRSLYFSKGYFDADVRVGEVETRGSDARVSFLIHSGPRRQPAPNTRELCSCLLAKRREAWRQGILDFSARLNADNMTPIIDRGQAYRVGRIDFLGNRHYSDAAIRRNFVLDEGEPLDEMLLHKSVARLNRAMWFEPVDTRHVLIRPNDKTGTADITVRLTERKRGAWGLSGPVGPASFAGPLQASLSERLPGWGKGVAELSTYTASISLIAFAHPVVPILLASKAPLLPVLALQRPFSPGEGWRSGVVIAPQIGWKGSALSYGITQAQQRLLHVLTGDRGLVPELAVTVERPQGDGMMFCDPPKPRMSKLRTGAALAVQYLGALMALY